jgi:hypothetical protein
MRFKKRPYALRESAALHASTLTPSGAAGEHRQPGPNNAMEPAAPGATIEAPRLIAIVSQTI